MPRRNIVDRCVRSSWQFGPLIYELTTVRRRDSRVHTAVNLGLAAVAAAQGVGSTAVALELRRLEPALSSSRIASQSSSYGFTMGWSLLRSFDQWRRLWPGWVGLLAVSTWTRADDEVDDTGTSRRGPGPAAVALALTIGLGLGARRARDSWWRTTMRASIVVLQAMAQGVVFAALQARRPPQTPETPPRSLDH